MEILPVNNHLVEYQKSKNGKFSKKVGQIQYVYLNMTIYFRIYLKVSNLNINNR